MTVFREMVVEWGGENYTFTPSNKFLRRVDREVSLASLADRAERGDAPIFDMAFVVAEIMREAGVDTDEDEVISQITDESETDRAEYLIGLINKIMPDRSADSDEPVKKTKAKSKK